MDKSFLSEVIKKTIKFNDNSFKSFLYDKESLNEISIIRTGNFVADMFKLIRKNYMDMANVFINDYDGISQFSKWVLKLRDKFKIRNPESNTDMDKLYSAVKNELSVNEATTSHSFNELFSSQDLNGLLDAENIVEEMIGMSTSRGE